MKFNIVKAGNAVNYYNDQEELVFSVPAALNGMKEYYKNGRLSSTAEFENGVLNGQYVGYNANEDKQFLRTYANGKLDGISYNFYADGPIEAEIDYRQNQRQSYTLFYPDVIPKIKMYVPYKDGKRHGEQICYDENGQENRVVPWRDDKIHGTVFRRLENGHHSEVQYVDNNRSCIEKEFDEAGVHIKDHIAETDDNGVEFSKVVTYDSMERPIKIDDKHQVTTYDYSRNKINIFPVRDGKLHGKEIVTDLQGKPKKVAFETCHLKGEIFRLFLDTAGHVSNVPSLEPEFLIQGLPKYKPLSN